MNRTNLLRAALLTAVCLASSTALGQSFPLTRNLDVGKTPDAQNPAQKPTLSPGGQLQTPQGSQTAPGATMTWPTGKPATPSQPTGIPESARQLNQWQQSQQPKP